MRPDRTVRDEGSSVLLVTPPFDLADYDGRGFTRRYARTTQAVGEPPEKGLLNNESREARHVIPLPLRGGLLSAEPLLDRLDDRLGRRTADVVHDLAEGARDRDTERKDLGRRER